MKRVLVLATAVAALLVPTAPASAGLLDGCGDRALERPFLRFLDPLAYTLVPGEWRIDDMDVDPLRIW